MDQSGRGTLKGINQAGIAEAKATATSASKGSTLIEALA